MAVADHRVFFNRNRQEFAPREKDVDSACFGKRRPLGAVRMQVSVLAAISNQYSDAIFLETYVLRKSFMRIPSPHPNEHLDARVNASRSYREHCMCAVLAIRLPSNVYLARGESRESMKILVADDNELVRRGVVNILARVPQWEVCGEAKDGTEAVQRAIELLPDLILLDISMPGLDGLDVARRLRKEVPAAKILIMSQNDSSVLRSSAIQAGAHGCVDKSYLTKDLLPVIASITATGDDRSKAPQ